MAKAIEEKLQSFFCADFVSCEDVSSGCGAKYQVVVVSSKFQSVSPLDRQREVNKCLEEEMKTIHALEMRCWTPKQYEKRKLKGSFF